MQGFGKGRVLVSEVRADVRPHAVAQEDEGRVARGGGLASIFTDVVVVEGAAVVAVDEVGHRAHLDARPAQRALRTRSMAGTSGRQQSNRRVRG